MAETFDVTQASQASYLAIFTTTDYVRPWLGSRLSSHPQRMLLFSIVSFLRTIVLQPFDQVALLLI